MKVEIKAKKFKDKATDHWIIYSEEFNISAYGVTIKQARDMFVFIVKDILKRSVQK